MMADPTSPKEGSVPSTMRAWTYSSPGRPADRLTLNESHPTPTLSGPAVSPTSVLVRISHAALNPGGSIAMQLFPGFFHSAPKPWVPEMDFSGSIVALGSGVAAKRDDLRPGDEVFGVVEIGSHLKAGAGTLGEYAVTEAEYVVRKPANATLEDVAGFGIAGSTAMVMMQRADLQPGERVLIVGGSGGIGCLVVQLARRAVGRTGYIVAVCSQGNFDLVKSLGADECVDYRAKDRKVENHLASVYGAHPFDRVLDTIGVPAVYHNSGSYLKKGKDFVSVGVKMTTYTRAAMFWSVVGIMKNFLLPGFLGGGSRKYIQVTSMAPIRKNLEELKDAVEAGDLRGVVDSVWPMEDAHQAYERFLNGNLLKGKVLLKIS